LAVPLVRCRARGPEAPRQRDRAYEHGSSQMLRHGRVLPSAVLRFLLRCDGGKRCRDAARHGSVRLQPDHRLQMTSRMTVKHVVGAALVVIGLVSLLWGGFRWTENKTVVDIGPVKATAEEHKTLPIPPVVGALLLV